MSPPPLSFNESEQYLELFEDQPKKTRIKYPSIKSIIYSLLPPLAWVPEYKDNWRENLPGDIRAGLTIGILLIPQGLAYALLAELPVQYGLFSSFMPPLVYGLFGTSKELSVSPVAIVALLTASGVSPIYDPETETAEYIAACIALAFVVGLVKIGMGILRLGFIVNFLSAPVLSGFTSASALVIGLSQLKHALGIDTIRSSVVHEVLESTFEEIKHINWVTVGITLGTAAILVFWKYTPSTPKLDWFRKYVKPLPSTMIVVVLMTVISSQLDLKTTDNVSVVGFVPGGLPKPAVPETKDFGQLIVLSFTITIIGYMQAMAIAKKYADEKGNKLDYNQELIALGLSNVIGAFFQSYPSTGAFSRTAVNANAGCKTQVSGILSVIIVLIALVAATDLFFDLPRAVLGTIIIVAVIPLVDVVEPFRLWKFSKLECFVHLLTFALTAFVGVELGVGISVAVSLLIIVWNASRPNSTLEGRLPGTEVYRSIPRYPDAEEPEGVKIFRFDANIFFANVSLFEEKFKKRCFKPNIKYAIIHLSPANDIDTAGINMLRKLLEECKARDLTILVADMKGPVRDRMLRVGLIEDFGKGNFYRSVHGAVLAAEERMAANPLPITEELEDGGKDTDAPAPAPTATNDANSANRNNTTTNNSLPFVDFATADLNGETSTDIGDALMGITTI